MFICLTGMSPCRSFVLGVLSHCGEILGTIGYFVVGWDKVLSQTRMRVITRFPEMLLAEVRPTE